MAKDEKSKNASVSIVEDPAPPAEPVFIELPQIERVARQFTLLVDRQRAARAEAANQLRVAKDALNIAQARLGDEGEVQGEIDALLASLL